MIPKKNIDNKLLYVFLAVPLFSSIMSAIHLISMVSLGNQMVMAIALAITFELGSIVSFVAMGKNIMKRLKKELLYWVFGILFILQAFGNIYSSFDYIRKSLIKDPTWLDSFREMFFNVLDVTTTKLTLAILIGLPIPIISLILLKAAVDYFSSEDEVPVIPVQGKPEHFEDEKKLEEPFIPKPMGHPLPDIELIELANEHDRHILRNIISGNIEVPVDTKVEESTEEAETVAVVASEPINYPEVSIYNETLPEMTHEVIIDTKESADNMTEDLTSPANDDLTKPIIEHVTDPVAVESEKKN